MGVDFFAALLPCYYCCWSCARTNNEIEFNEQFFFSLLLFASSSTSSDLFLCFCPIQKVWMENNLRTKLQRVFLVFGRQIIMVIIMREKSDDFFLLAFALLFVRVIICMGWSSKWKVVSIIFIASREWSEKKIFLSTPLSLPFSNDRKLFYFFGWTAARNRNFITDFLYPPGDTDEKQW